MAFKRIFLLFALSGIIINVDAAKRPAQGAPEGEPEAKELCRASLSDFQDWFPQEINQVILSFYYRLMSKCHGGPDALLKVIRTARLTFRLSVHAVIELLRTYHRDNWSLMDSRDSTKQTVLHLACIENDADSVRIICCLPPNSYQLLRLLKSQDDNENTPLHQAVHTYDCAETILFAAGSQAYDLMHIRNKQSYSALTAGEFGRTPFMSAAASWSEQEGFNVLKMFLNKAEKRAYDLIIMRCARGKYTGTTSFMLARSAETRRIFLKAAGEKALTLMFITNDRGETILHVMVSTANIIFSNLQEDIKKLLDYVDNDTIRRTLILMPTKEGKTVIDYVDDAINELETKLSFECKQNSGTWVVDKGSSIFEKLRSTKAMLESYL